MKNVIGVASVTLATAAIGWSFGSGSLTVEAACLVVAAWIGISWSCMQD
jgi:uncharacterized membrane protein